MKYKVSNFGYTRLHCFQILDAEASKDQTSDLTEELSVLKEFDLDSEFGPCIGTLIRRLIHL